MDDAQASVVRGLEEVSRQLKAQTSIWYVFRNGIIYGVGFVIGSTVLTGVIVTFGFTFFGDTIFGDIIAWIVATN